MAAKRWSCLFCVVVVAGALCGCGLEQSAKSSMSNAKEPQSDGVEKVSIDREKVIAIWTKTYEAQLKFGDDQTHIMQKRLSELEALADQVAQPLSPDEYQRNQEQMRLIVEFLPCARTARREIEHERELLRQDQEQMQRDQERELQKRDEERRRADERQQKEIQP